MINGQIDTGGGAGASNLGSLWRRGCLHFGHGRGATRRRRDLRHGRRRGPRNFGHRGSGKLSRACPRGRRMPGFGLLGRRKFLTRDDLRVGTWSAWLLPSATGVGSAVGCMNAPVAPSPGKELGREGSGLSTGTLGDGGIAGAGRFGITTGAGGDAAKTGSGTGVAFIGVTAGRG